MPKFQSRHYEAIARTLGAHYANMDRYLIGSQCPEEQEFVNGYKTGVTNAAQAVARLFERDNENFDRERFLSRVYRTAYVPSFPEEKK